MSPKRSRNSTVERMVLSKRYLGCASILQSGTAMFMVLYLWLEEDGRSGGPMGVKETSAMEVIFDWRLEGSTVSPHLSFDLEKQCREETYESPPDDGRGGGDGETMQS
ncbi:hypothetical protein TNCV_608771 [Trichonephila clavipes]|nr:hypothetical protein TNCV_608771 [Trichonephila clavipes]